jgi:hypothetical protein
LEVHQQCSEVTKREVQVPNHRPQQLFANTQHRQLLPKQLDSPLKKEQNSDFFCFSEKDLFYRSKEG